MGKEQNQARVKAMTVNEAVKDLREKAYKRLTDRGVRYPMPDQVVAEMKRISASQTGGAQDFSAMFEKMFGR